MKLEPFGADRGWKTIVGWIIFAIGSLGAGLASHGHPLAFGVEPKMWLTLVGIGAAWAGIGHRDAQSKQAKTVREHSEMIGKFVDILTNPGAALTGGRSEPPAKGGRKKS